MGDTHDTLPFFDAIFFPQWKVSFLPSATSLCLVLGAAGVGATVGNGNSEEGEADTLADEARTGAFEASQIKTKQSQVFFFKKRASFHQDHHAVGRACYAF